ncbi:hypothetical protein SRHO_G00257170 [Serrasalmus rhombeus]
MVARPAVLSTVQLCSVDGRQYQCLPEYQPRVLIVRNTFILMDMMPSDSGNYTVQEKDNTPVSISHVTVKVVEDSWIWKSAYEKGKSDGYQTGVGFGALAVGVAALVIMIGVFFLGVFAAPQVRLQMDSCVQMPRGSRIPPPHLLHADLPASIREALQVMQLHRKGHCDLIVLITVFTAGSLSAPVKVKLHDSATLSCSGRCSGLVRWTEFSDRTDVLAECNQTSCRSVKEGYQMIHDQYLKEDFSLIITDADFTKRGSYTSDCDGEDLCDVKLKIEPLNCTVQMEPGESLVLMFDVSDPMEVIYNSTVTAGPSSGQICTVGGRSLQCKPEYTQRASLTSALELRNMTPSDSGLYAVMDKRNEDVLHTYTVTVQVVQDSWIWKTTYEKGKSDGYQTGVWFGALAVGVAALFIMFGERVHFEIRTQLESLRAELMTRHLIERRVCKVHAEVGWRSRPELITGTIMQSVMQSCSSALWVLSLLTTTFTIGSESVNGPVRVKLHDSATLSCSERCSGLARWTLFSKRSDTLAECDQTSCRSVKEGYQMIQDQYLKGNLSLIITDADFSKRGWYTSDCASKDVCDVHLQIAPLNTTVEMMAGESLILRVDVSVAVDVTYKSTGTPGPSSGQICTVDGPSLQCKPEYTQRSSLTSGANQ